MGCILRNFKNASSRQWRYFLCDIDAKKLRLLVAINSHASGEFFTRKRGKEPQGSGNDNNPPCPGQRTPHRHMRCCTMARIAIVTGRNTAPNTPPGFIK